MSPKKPTKVLLLLASSGINDADIEAFTAWCEIAGGRYVVDVIKSIRNHQRKLSLESLDFDYPLAQQKYSTSRSPSGDVAYLLRSDTRLSISLAAKMLIDRLQKRPDIDPDVISSIPPIGKSSFDSWITRLSRLVPYSILLQEATLIRNEMTHRGVNADWPLKRGDV